MEPDIRKLNLFYYTNVVHGYFRNAKVQEKAFTINSEKKIATLALPLKGIKTEKNFTSFCIDISSMASRGAGKISLFGSSKTKEITFSDLTNFKSSVEIMLPLDTVNGKSVNKMPVLKDFTAIVKKYLNDNRIEYSKFEYSHIDNSATLRLPLKNIETDKESKVFCIDIDSNDDKKIMILDVSEEILREMNFKNVEEFTELIQLMLPLRSEMTNTIRNFGMRIEKIEKQIDAIMKTLTNKFPK